MKDQSNIYREQMMVSANVKQYSRLATMKPVEDGEMEAFVALQIAMGLNNKPAISDYWSTYWLTRVQFSDVMARNRYENLSYALHFADNTERIPAGQEGYDPLFKVRQLLTIVDPQHKGGYCTVCKPIIADSYNANMGKVDTMDQLLRTYCYPHKVSKWYHAVYQRVREVALTNGYIVYTIHCENIGQKPLPPKAFREAVIDGLLEGFTPALRHSRQNETPRPLRLTERHFPFFNQGSDHRPDCVVCSSRSKPGWKRVQTRWECKQCQVPMCADRGCFEIYHTKRDFQRHAGQVFYNVD